MIRRWWWPVIQAESNLRAWRLEFLGTRTVDYRQHPEGWECAAGDGHAVWHHHAPTRAEAADIALAALMERAREGAA